MHAPSRHVTYELPPHINLFACLAVSPRRAALANGASGAPFTRALTFAIPRAVRVAFAQVAAVTGHLFAVSTLAFRQTKSSTYPSSDAADQSQIVPSREIIRTLVAHRSPSATGIQVAEMPLERRGSLPAWREGGAASGAGGPASADIGLPELTEFLAQFLSGRRPVVLDAVTKLCHITLDVQLVLLQPRHVEFLAGCAALELPLDVLVIVTDNPGKRVSACSPELYRPLGLTL